MSDTNPVQYEQDDGSIPPDVDASGELDEASVVGATSLDPLGPIQGMPAPESNASTDATNEVGLAMLEPEAEVASGEAETGAETGAEPAAPVDVDGDGEPDMSPDPDYKPNNGWADATGGLLEKALARFPDYGWSGQHTPALIALWNEASSPYTQSHTGTAHWRPDAENYMNGAFGIPGLLPDTYESMGANKMKLDDPEEQMRIGFEYIKGKYDNPTKALQHMRQFNWY